MSIVVAAGPNTAAQTRSTAQPAADPSVDRALDALISRGSALDDHVGPAAAQSIRDDLARRPSDYFARIEQRFAVAPLHPSAASGELPHVLWRLRAYDEPRARALAARLAGRFRALLTSPPANDPGFPARVSAHIQSLEVLANGVDVPSTPVWRDIPASRIGLCTTAAPEHPWLLRVTRACGCGEAVACSAALVNGTLRVEARYNPASGGACDECYPGSSACTLPVLPASRDVSVEVGGHTAAVWHTDAAGRPREVSCR